MQRFKKLGVFLHDSPSDSAALAYAGAIADHAQTEQVLCIHVHEPTHEDEEPDPKDFEKHVLGQLPDNIAQKTTVELHPGTGVREILRGARDHELDLVIVGRRLPSEQLGIGSAFARLARKAPCHVLAVPSQSRPHLGRVLVGVDFSDHSRKALDLGIAFARAFGGDSAQVVVASNFAVGYGYRKIGLTLEKAVNEREKNTREQLANFLRDFDVSGLDIELVCTSAEDPDTGLQEVAISRKMDIIVIGSRGTELASLLGSTSERLLIHTPLPVLIAKKKGETTGILDALFGN